MCSNPMVAEAAAFMAAPVEPPKCLLVFRLDGRRYAWPLSAVERIVHAASITALPGAPPMVRGVIDFADRRLPVLSLPQRFGLVEPPLGLGDAFLVVQVGLRRVALVIDEVQEIIEQPPTWPIDSGPLGHVPGIVGGDDGLVVIDDPERLLSADDELALEDALGSMH